MTRRRDGSWLLAYTTSPPGVPRDMHDWEGNGGTLYIGIGAAGVGLKTATAAVDPALARCCSSSRLPPRALGARLRHDSAAGPGRV